MKKKLGNGFLDLGIHSKFNITFLVLHIVLS